MKRTQSEELISLKGHITGVKASLKVLSCAVYKLERRLEKLFWSILLAFLGLLFMLLLLLFILETIFMFIQRLSLI